MRYTAPGRDLFAFSHVNLKLIAKKLVKVMEDTTLAHHPIFFHNFSNHGATLYAYISQYMQSCSGEIPLDVAGCIFDSAPSPPRFRSAVKVIFGTTKGSIFFRLLTTSFFCTCLCIWKALRVLTALLTGHLPSSPPWSLLQEPYRWPQLFMYSTVDDLVSHQDIELFASEREQLGVNVRSHNFSDSPHVLHYKVHSEEYIEVVRKFISSCMDGHIPKKIVSTERIVYEATL